MTAFLTTCTAFFTTKGKNQVRGYATSHLTRGFSAFNVPGGVDTSAAELITDFMARQRGKPLEMPSRLSPTAMSNFQECPQSILSRNLLKLPQPTNKALARGTLVHTALEKFFDFPPEERTQSNLHDLLRQESVSLPIVLTLCRKGETTRVNKSAHRK